MLAGQGMNHLTVADDETVVGRLGKIVGAAHHQHASPAGHVGAPALARP